MYTLRPNLIRPCVALNAKKHDFVAPSDAPGEGNRRFPTRDEKDVNPIKKFIMKVFKIEEIDHEKFQRENKWAIKINKR